MVEGYFESAFKNRLIDNYKNNADARFEPKSTQLGKL
jgi:hypothetical protein